MRCRNCDYRLWNLTSRLCPECGTSFLPSEYEFAVNSVQFCCPHCRQPYYGTSRQGHLVPMEFDCARCGRHIHMDEMVLLPTQGIDEELTQVEVMPWLERRSGVVRSWLATIGMALTKPTRLIKLVPRESPIYDAMLFAVVTNTIALLTGVALVFVFPLIVAFGAGGGPGTTASVALGLGTAFLGAVVAVLLGLALWGLVAHGLLRLTGQVQDTLRRTYHALCYSSGANVFSGIPCIGFYLGWVWWAISAVLMVKEGQKVHGARAALAIVTPPLVIVAAMVSVWIWTLSTAMGRFGAMSANPPTQVIVDGLLAYAGDHQGRFPGHAVQLVAGDYVTAFDMVATGSDTYEKDVPIADATLEAFSALDKSRQRTQAQRVAAAQPRDLIAHRLGDFVFCYHGLDPATADGSLWLTVLSPDPDHNPAPDPTDFIAAGLADGSVEVFAAKMLAARLRAQNAARSASGLPSLPVPTTITHDKPARGSATAPLPSSASEGRESGQNGS